MFMRLAVFEAAPVVGPRSAPRMVSNVFPDGVRLVQLRVVHRQNARGMNEECLVNQRPRGRLLLSQLCFVLAVVGLAAVVGEDRVAGQVDDAARRACLEHRADVEEEPAPHSSTMNVVPCDQLPRVWPVPCRMAQRVGAPDAVLQHHWVSCVLARPTPRKREVVQSEVVCLDA